MIKLNERTKRYMEEQSEGIYEELKAFGLSVYEDEVAEDEEEELFNSDKYNFFTIEYSDISATSNIRQLSQLIIIDYYSEDRNDVWEVVVDVVTKIKNIKAVTFDRARKERLRMSESDRYVDRVSIVFKRVIKLEC